MKTKPRRRKPLPNGARAIMGSRKESKRSKDFFPTPPWATRALMEQVLPRHVCMIEIEPRTVWEPACGEGHMAEVLRDYFAATLATDIKDYGYELMNGRRADFLRINLVGPFDWIITNPPYAKAEEFALRALEIAQIGVAVFVRVQFLETIGRYERIFRDKPPTLVAFFTERVPIQKGRWKPKGTTATAYCWLVWIKGHEPMPPFWIPPGQRKALTRPDDRARFAAWSLPQAEAVE